MRPDTHPLLEGILDFIYVAFRRLIPYDRIALALPDPTGRVIHQVWQRTDDPGLEVTDHYSGPLEGSSLTEVARTGAPRIINDLEAYLWHHPESRSSAYFVAKGIRSSLTCPIDLGDDRYGFLFFSAREPHTYQAVHTQTYLQISERIAELIADLNEAGVDGSTLGHLLRGLADALDRAHRELALLEGLSERISAGLSLESVLDHVFDTFAPCVPYDRIELVRLEDEGRVVRSDWLRFSDAEADEPPPLVQVLAESELVDVVNSGVPKTVDDAHEYLAQHPDCIRVRLLVASGFRSILYCPLIWNQEPLGVLVFSCRDPSRYQAYHRSVLRRLSRQIGAALGKAAALDRVDAERRISDELLYHMVPPTIARQLKRSTGPIARSHESVGVLFADIRGFTGWAHQLPPVALVRLLNRVFGEFDRAAKRRGVLKIRNIGDGYMAASGVPKSREGHLEDLCDLGLELLAIAQSFDTPEGRPISMRVAIHCGPVVAGVIGRATLQYDVWGSTVNLAARLEPVATAGVLTVSQSVAERVASSFELRRGRVSRAKGFPDQQLFEILGRR